ncbi:phospholipase D family protein [Paraburkholderia jirisanensis]
MTLLRRLLPIVLLVFLHACASLPPQTTRTPSYSVTQTDTANTRLGIAFAPEQREHVGQTAFRLLPDPVDALVARIVLTEHAERTLDLQYYIWHDDLTGRALAAALLQAADRGVRVRVLLDDLGTNADDQLLLALNSHANLQIRLFNPVANRSFKTVGAGLEFFRVNRRMHNKALIADSQGAILGGRNIGDEYFGASTVVDFGDLDVLVHGAVVGDVSHAFDEYWNSAAAYPIDALVGHRADPAALAGYRDKLDAYLASEQSSPYAVAALRRLHQALDDDSDAGFSWGKATLLYDDPDKITRAPSDVQGHLMSQFKALNLRAEQQMLIVSPYFVPGKDGVAWIRDMTQRGVRVTILTNSLAATDVAAVHAGYQRYRKDLLAAGVTLYELKPTTNEGAAVKKSLFGSSKASLHAKTYVFDRKRIFIGSMNLDPRSIELNTEIGVLCESGAAAAAVADGVEQQLAQAAWRVEQRTDANGASRIVWIDTDANGNATELDTEPGVSAWRRTGIWFLGLLPVESQL